LGKGHVLTHSTEIVAQMELARWLHATEDAAWLTAFHSFAMFSGYWLRFFAVPRLPTVLYSILNYAGLLAAYIFGLVFLGERPSWMSLLGAAIILLSGLLLQLPSPLTL
jgi:drug/metabolite transporter (DMT)-like permease